MRSLDQAPDYPVQLMVGLFDFPDRDPADHSTPELVASRVRGRPLPSTEPSTT